jgi:hypothetical protein
MKTNSRKYFLCFKNRNEISDEKLIVNDDFHHQDNYLMIRNIQQKKNIL